MAVSVAACGPVLVVDDDAGVRACVTAALRAAGFETAEAARGEEALTLAARGAYRLAVVDVNLPGLSGYELCHLLLERSPAVPVIFVSGERTEHYDRVAGLLLGADDYMSKPFAPDELVARVRAVLRRTASAAPPGRARSLTPRELEVLTLLAEGHGHTDVAASLFISPKTVATHVEHIFEKLGVRSRAQAVAVAYREHLVSPR